MKKLLFCVVTMFIGINILYSQTWSLKIESICVVDNGEGVSFPRGPLGNLHVICRDENSPCPKYRSEYNGRGPVIPGPSRGEWLDCDIKHFNSYHVITTNSNTIQVIIYESDDAGGNDETLFCDKINKNSFDRYGMMVKRSRYPNKANKHVDRTNIRNVYSWLNNYMPYQANLNFEDLGMMYVVFSIQ